MSITAHVWETGEAPESANMKPMHVAVLSNAEMSMAQLGEEAYYALEGRADGQRTLFLRHLGEQRSGVADLMPDTYADFMATGPRETAWKASMENFWGGFAQCGSMRPSRIVIEFEQHWRYYAIPGDAAARAATIQAARDAGATRKYPKDFAAYTQAILAAHNNAQSASAPGIVLHDAAVKRIMNDAIRNVVLGTYASVMGQAAPASSNYDDVRLRVPYTDADGYTFPAKVLCVGSDSSPSLYFRPDGARFSSIVGDGAKQFAATKAMVELVRSCRGPVVPWVGPPGYRGDVFAKQSEWAGWRKFIHTLALHGVSEVLYFIGNYSETTEEREYAEETFATAVVVRPSANHRWGRPSIDTTTLTTGTGGWVENEFAYSAGDWT